LPPPTATSQTTDPVDKAFDGPSEVTDTAVNHAIGKEIRRAREGRGWTRGEVVRHMASGISVQALANYEYGLRPCTMPRLVEICQALGVVTSDLVAIALQRICVEFDMSKFQIDLHAVMKDEEDRFKPLRSWAQIRLDREQDNQGIAQMDPTFLEEMAAFFGLSFQEFLDYLQKFVPVRPRRLVVDLVS
jgi:transcriptional regulator with XRE-family HTH domain